MKTSQSWMNCSILHHPLHWKRRWSWGRKQGYYFEKSLSCKAECCSPVGKWNILYALVERWKDCCFIVLLLSVMSLIKFSTVVVWDSLKTNVSQPAVFCWLPQRMESINVPDASPFLGFILLYRCALERWEIGIRTTAAGIFKLKTLPTHWHTI